MEQSTVVIQSQPSTFEYWFAVKRRTMHIAVVLLAIALTTALVVWLYPRQFKSVARIQLEAWRPVVPSLAENEQVVTDALFLQTQVESVQSPKTLESVIERLKLQKHWNTVQGPLAMDAAVRRLSDRLTVQRKAGTNIIDISVIEDDAELSASIANAIADAFVINQVARAEQLKERGQQLIASALVSQEKQLQAAQAKSEQIRKELNLPRMTAGAAEPIASQAFQTQLDTATLEVVRSQVRVRTLKQLLARQLYGVIATLANDSTLRDALQKSEECTGRIAVLTARYGQTYPEVLRLVEMRNQLNGQIEQWAQITLRSAELDQQIADAHVQELKARLDERQQLSLAESERAAPYRAALHEEELQVRAYDSLKTRLQQDAARLALSRMPQATIDYARVPTSPVGPAMLTALITALAVGLIVGVVFALSLDSADTSFKKVSDIERSLHLPILGVVQKLRPSRALGIMENYRMLRNSIDYLRAEQPFKAFCVASAGAGEGKSFTVSHMAHAWAEQGLRVLVVDTDFQHPTIPGLLGVSNETGLADFLNGRLSVNQIVQPSAEPGISVIAAGQMTDSMPLVAGGRLRELVRQVGLQYDLVIYDTPAVLQVSNATLIAREVGTTLLLIQHRKYPRHMAIRAKQMLLGAGSRIVGTVINSVHADEENAFFGYHDHYDYYYRPSNARALPPLLSGKKPKSLAA